MVGLGRMARDRAPAILVENPNFSPLPCSITDHYVINQDVFRRRGHQLDGLGHSTGVRKIPCASEHNICRCTDHVHFGTAWWMLKSRDGGNLRRKNAIDVSQSYGKDIRDSSLSLMLFDCADRVKRVEKAEGWTGPVFSRGCHRSEGEAQVSPKSFVTVTLTLVNGSPNTVKLNGPARPPPFVPHGTTSTRTRSVSKKIGTERKNLTKLWSEIRVGHAIRSSSDLTFSTILDNTRIFWSIGRGKNRQVD